ncbi:hypothetical protein GCK32_012053 [Trichostrongylus colubriformis]|uniref:Uncharacterized protein n=1 Tax=Trichostrongylus colubriformis TaxID=6319 RepID=A0AAN8FYG3_TRICO
MGFIVARKSEMFPSRDVLIFFNADSSLYSTIADIFTTSTLLAMSIYVYVPLQTNFQLLWFPF